MNTRLPSDNSLTGLDVAQTTTTAHMYQLHLKNKLEDLSSLSEWVESCAEQLDMSARGIFRLQLLLEEIVTNVIKNGYDDCDEHLILVRLQVVQNSGHNQPHGQSTDKAIQVSITDDGMEFDPLAYPEVVLPQSLDEAEVGGLGIHLIRRYADTCSYQRSENLNILTVTIVDP